MSGRAATLGIAALCVSIAIEATWLGLHSEADLKALLDGFAADGDATYIPLQAMGWLRLKLFFVAGFALFGAAFARPLGAATLECARLPGMAWAKLRAFAQREPGEVAWAAAATLLGLALAVPRLDQTLHYDEALTFVHYVRKPLPLILGYYTTANNHILHSLLAHGAYLLLGAAPWILRLPALVCGVLCIPATFGAARVLAGPRAARVAAFLPASWLYLVDQTANARGYSLANLSFLLLLALAPGLARFPTRARWQAVCLLTAIGFFAVPVMVLPCAVVVLFAGSEAWAAGRLPAFLKGALRAALVVSLLVALLYLPALLVMNEESTLHFQKIARWEAEQPGFFSRFRRLAGHFVPIWNFGLPTWAVVYFLGTLVLGCVRLPRLALSAAAGFLLVTSLSTLPPPWSLSYVGFIAAILVAAGASGRLAIPTLLILGFVQLPLHREYTDRATTPWFVGYADAELAAGFFLTELPVSAAPVIAGWEAGVSYHCLVQGGEPVFTPYPHADLDGVDAVYAIERDTPIAAQRASRLVAAELAEAGFVAAETLRSFPVSRIVLFERRISR